MVAWLWMILLLTVTHLGLADQGAGIRLVAILSALFYGIKVLVAVEARLAGGPVLGLRDWLAFALIWPGMQAAEFVYFGLHGVAMAIEQWLERHGKKLRGWLARVWV